MRVDTRPSWDEYFIGVAVAVSARGDCLRSQVGAVLVEDVTHRIIATGYNGSPPGGPSCLAGECPRCLSSVPSGSNYEGCIEIHAERNCMDYANSYVENFLWYGHTMYLTRQPCLLCYPMLFFEEGISRVIYIKSMFWDCRNNIEYILEEIR